MNQKLLTYQGAQLFINGQPMRILSGAVHYFRIMPDYWADRLQKLKACGFNTVETYIPWNLHEPEPGQYNYQGLADLRRFIELARQQDLWVILRPSPYICSEWDFGGLPYWLLTQPGMRLRCFNQPFLSCVDRYYDDLIPRLRPYQSSQGGPVIAMQIENEYGSYGNDKDYLAFLRDSLISRGIDVPLFTSDGPENLMLGGGTLPGILKTVNFGSQPEDAFSSLKAHQPDAPLMCMEFWNGWFDHWSEKHHTRPAAEVADVLSRMLKADASVNFYMFHGGTNFGFYNGANDKGDYEPTITSYDSDAPLNEAGEPTDKFWAVREVLSQYHETPLPQVPQSKPARAFGTLPFTEQASLFSSLSQLSEPRQSATPEPMESFGQAFGFILYQTKIKALSGSFTLRLPRVNDRAMIFIDGIYQGVLERRLHQHEMKIELDGQPASLSILVENMGRVNYGENLFDQKGLGGAVLLDYQHLFDWTIHPLPLHSLDPLPFTPIAAAKQRQANNIPAFFRTTLTIDDPADTYIDCSSWSKGQVFVNGFNLGRYWSLGPQQTMYLPAPLLKRGENEIIVFELHPDHMNAVKLVSQPVLG